MKISIPFAAVVAAGLCCCLPRTQARADDLSQINASAAWAVTTDCRGSGGSVVVVVVFGTGLNPTLPQLSSNILTNPIDTTADGVDEDHNGYIDDIYGWNFWSNNNNPWPENGDPYPWHETAVTGILAGNGTSGVSGVCPIANVYPLKKGPIEDVSMNTSVPDKVAAGLYYAINLKSELQSYYGQPVHMVINNSYILMRGTAAWNRFPQVKTAIDAAAAADIGMFFAATNASESNDDPNTAAYPASYASPNVVSVGAVDWSDHLSSVSNYGNAVHIAAPAVGITLVLDTGQVGVDLAGTQGFTSFATPHVTAAAAMYWSQNPNASFAQVKAALLNTADHIPGLPVLNGNRLNLGRLIGGGGGVGPISPDGSVISGGTGSLTTSAGTWTFGMLCCTGNWYILLNGMSAGGAVGNKMEVDDGGKLYLLGNDDNWYVWTGSAWIRSIPQGTGGTTASPDGTTINGPAGSLTTSAGTWTFGTAFNASNWYILLNGSSAGGGIGNKLEVSNGGKLYAVGHDGNWYLWNGSGWTPGSPQGTVTTTSPDGSTISGGTGSLTTPDGTWTFGAAYSAGNWYILLNGGLVGAGSKMEVSNGGLLYAVGTEGNWYLWTGSGWTPSAPTGTVSTSASGTTIPPATQIVDSAGNVWTVSGGRSSVNGTPDGAATIVTLLWYNGVLYLNDSVNHWYSHASGYWSQIGGDPRA